MRHHRRPTIAGLALASLALLASACGDDGGDSPAAASSENTSESPVRVLVTGVEDNLQDLLDGAEAALKAVNDAGGIKGHPVEITSCSYPQSTPTDSNRCVRDAIADPSIVALVGSNVNSPDVDPLLEEAELANVGGFLGFGPDFTTPALLPVQGGSLLQSLAQGLSCVRLEAETLAVAYLDIAAGVAARDSIETFVIEPNGLPDMISVPIPLTATDLTPQANAVLDGDCVVVAAFGNYAVTLVQGILNAGYTKPIVVGGAAFSPQLIGQYFGADVENIYTANMANVGSPGYEEFLREAEAYDEEIVPRLNDFSQQAWLALHLVADVANGVPGDAVPSRATMWTELHQVKGYDTKGITIAPLDFTVQGTAFGGTVPNLFPSLTGMWVNHFADGALEPVGDNEPMPAPS